MKYETSDLAKGARTLPADGARVEADATTDARVADDLIVAFEPGAKRVSEVERDVVRRWARAWLARRPDATVLMGCSAGVRASARATRVERLRGLRDSLVRLGVSAERIRYTGDELGALDRMPGERRSTVWMRAVRSEALESGVMPIRALFTGVSPREGGECTSAS